LHRWIKEQRQPPEQRQASQDQPEELRRLRFELKRRARHSKKGRRVLCRAIRVKYAFIKSQESQHSVRRMCRLLERKRGLKALLS
jgi:hypothetical protein